MAGICLGTLVVGGLVGAGVGYLAQPEPVQIIKQVPVEVIKEVPVEVLKEVNVTVEVPVDNGDLARVLEFGEDAGFFEDAKTAVQEIDALDAALELAVEEIKDEGLDFLEDEGLFVDEDDLEFVKIKSDFKDVTVVDSDYDDEEYEFEIKAKVDDDVTDDKYWVVFTVQVEDGKAELKSVVMD